ncbi:hypothetical protein E2C01_060709 [Portunus trituberculatus]|uniref:Uncharacterized protein n=1 Tax=Portunus trituberculatus TaxID=210409 RepID=A0A5B7H3B1_PORTR|nr:hypothetical protein [Portunus trituberculatus]
MGLRQRCNPTSHTASRKESWPRLLRSCHVIRTTPDAMEHFLLHCPCFHFQYTALCSRFSVLAIITLHGHAHPPSRWPQASTPPGNLLSFALLVPS